MKPNIFVSKLNLSEYLLKYNNFTVADVWVCRQSVCYSKQYNKIAI